MLSLLNVNDFPRSRKAIHPPLRDIRRSPFSRLISREWGRKGNVVKAAVD